MATDTVGRAPRPASWAWLDSTRPSRTRRRWIWRLPRLQSTRPIFRGLGRPSRAIWRRRCGWPVTRRLYPASFATFSRTPSPRRGPAARSRRANQACPADQVDRQSVSRRTSLSLRLGWVHCHPAPDCRRAIGRPSAPPTGIGIVIASACLTPVGHSANGRRWASAAALCRTLSLAAAAMSLLQSAAAVTYAVALRAGTPGSSPR